MRKIRGWIKTLANASGPPAGTVEVAARFNDAVELDLEAHGLGYLDRTHQTGGAGSLNLADASGHFGWDMEFSPGPITTRIIASDPLPAQYRMRLPDESAQVGKAFHSDLERLGWAAGRDCLVYGAIEGAAQPDAASWSSDPLLSSGQGDWSVDLSSAATNPGRVTLRRGIGFLGGVVFSIEAGDLLVPVLGEDAAPANGGTEDRWDLLVAWMDVADPASATYGKQGISIQRGAAGDGIPTLEARTGYRQMILHALKMAAGGGVYTEASDLRPWITPPRLVTGESAIKIYGPYGGPQNPAGTFIPSALNTPLHSDPLILSTALAWDGTAIWDASCVFNGDTSSQTYGDAVTMTASTQAIGADGTVITEFSNDFVVRPTSGYWTRWGFPPLRSSDFPVPWFIEIPVAVTIPLRRIPAARDAGTNGRTWQKLRFTLQLNALGGMVAVKQQTLTAIFRPVA